MPKWLLVYTVQIPRDHLYGMPKWLYIATVQLLRLLYHVKSILSAWVHDHAAILKTFANLQFTNNHSLYKGAVISGTASIHISDL